MKVGFQISLILLLVSSTRILGITFEDQTPIESGLKSFTEAPTIRLVDLGEIFYGNEGQRDQLAQRLEKLAAEHRFSVYFVAYSGVIGSDVGEKAKLFRDHWLGAEKEGLILVCDTDTKTMSYSLTKVEGLPVTEDNPIWRLPDDEIIEVMRHMATVGSNDSSEEDYLVLVGNTLVDELTRRLEQKETRPSLRVGGLILTFAITAVLILGALWLIRRNASQAKTTAQAAIFPSFTIPTRLGASYGGGQVAEIGGSKLSDTSGKT